MSRPSIQQLKIYLKNPYEYTAYLNNPSLSVRLMSGGVARFFLWRTCKWSQEMSRVLIPPNAFSVKYLFLIVSSLTPSFNRFRAFFRIRWDNLKKPTSKYVSCVKIQEGWRHCMQHKWNGIFKPKSYVACWHVKNVQLNFNKGHSKRISDEKAKKKMGLLSYLYPPWRIPAFSKKIKN